MSVSLVVGENGGVPEYMEEENEIDATMEKMLCDSWALKGGKELLSLPNLLILQIRKLMAASNREWAPSIAPGDLPHNIQLFSLILTRLL